MGDKSWKETGVFVPLFPLVEPTGTIVSAICEFCVEEHSEGWDQIEVVGSFYNGKPDVLTKCCFPACLCGSRGTYSTEPPKELVLFGGAVTF